MGGWNALGWLLAVKFLQRPSLRYIISATIGFSVNVLVGLLSGYASQYPGAQYFIYLVFSASLYVIVFVFVLQFMETRVVNAAKQAISDEKSKESTEFSL